MSNLISIGEAAELCGVHIDTMRNWEKCGAIIPEYTVGGHRRYSLDSLKDLIDKPDNLFKNIRFDRCKNLWNQVKDLEQKSKNFTKKSSSLEKFKNTAADLIIPILIGEVNYYKKALEEFTSLNNKIIRLDKMIEADEKFEEFEKTLNQMEIRMSPQDGSNHAFDDRTISSDEIGYDEFVKKQNDLDEELKKDKDSKKQQG